MSTLDDLLARLKAKKIGSGWRALCPAHDDRSPSLSIGLEGDRILLHCHAGCSPENIVSAIDFELRGLFLNGNELQRPRTPRAEARVYGTMREAIESMQNGIGSAWSLTRKHVYTRADGSPVLCSLRFERGQGEKTFRLAASKSAGWILKDLPGLRPLFGLPSLKDATRVLVVEGEKCVEAAQSIGLVATTSAGGAKAASRTDWSPLAGKDVAILPDNDEPGRGYMAEVARILLALDPPARVRIVQLPGLEVCGDIADFVARSSDQGMTADDIREEILRLVQRAEFHRAESVEGSRPGTARRQTEAVVRSFSEIAPRTVRWLAPGLIPRGKLTLIAGEPGVGKSTIVANLAAQASRGLAWPGNHGTASAPVDGLLVCGEDDAEDTMRPRLEAAGAALGSVHLLEIRDDRGLRLFSLQDDLELLVSELEKRPDVGLVVIDPIGSHLGRADAHRDNEVRNVLGPLAAIAQRFDVAILVVAHTRKLSPGTRAIDSVLGSIGFVGIARSVILAMRDPDDAESRLLVHLKSNVAQLEHAWRFRLSSASEGAPARVEWLGRVDRDADEIFAALASGGAQLGVAKEWLETLLTDGPVRQPKIQESSDRDGIAWRTVQRAKKALGVLSTKEGEDRGWLWSMPFPSGSEDRHAKPTGNVGGLGALGSLDDERPVTTFGGSQDQERQGRQERHASEGCQTTPGAEAKGASDPYADQEREAIQAEARESEGDGLGHDDREDESEDVDDAA